MKTKHSPYYIFTALIFAFAACTKYEEVKSGNNTPSITYSGIIPLQVQQFEDSIKIKIKYKDGNGDLGDLNPDVLNISVKDNRLKKADLYHLHALAPTDQELAIEGELTIRLKNTFLVGSGNSEQTSYEVKIQDRAGDWSNVIVTDFITIIK